MLSLQENEPPVMLNVLLSESKNDACVYSSKSPLSRSHVLLFDTVRLLV